MSDCNHRPSPLRDDRPLRPDGTLDVAAWCAQLDLEANIGAGKPRPRDEDR